MKKRMCALGICIVAVCAALGCTPTQLSLNTTVGPLGLKKMPLSAALLVPDSIGENILVLDVSCADKYSIPVGREIEKGALQALSQVFEQVELVNDKAMLSGEEDVIIELQPPQLTVEGRCLTRRLSYLTLSLWQLFSTSDVFEARASFTASLSKTNGERISTDTYASQARVKEVPNGAYGSSKPTMIGELVQEVMAEAAAVMGRKMVYSSVELRRYAGSLKDKPTNRVPNVVPQIVRHSDVDDLPKMDSKPKQNRYALVIGIERYRQNLPRASFAAHDAEVMTKYLTKQLGYAEENVVTLLNEQAAKSDLEKYFEQWLPNRVEKDSTVFIYYSGHGAPSTRTNESHVVPYDGDPMYIDSTGYPLRRMYEHLGKLPAKEIVVVLDSCFSGTGGRSVIAKGMRPVGIAMDNPTLAEKTIVLTASSGAQASSTYEEKGHGLLTYFFLKGLQGDADQNKDGGIELSELYSYVKPRVEGVSRRQFNNEQTPQLLGSRGIISQGILLLGKTAH
jgi:caspase domain-containing protein